MTEITATIDQTRQILRHQLHWLWRCPQLATQVAPVMIWGAPGVGKSTVIRELCAELGIGFIDVRLAQREPVDIRGLPVPHERTTQLMRAAFAGDVPLLRTLLALGAPTAAVDAVGFGALHFAALGGHTRAAEVLLDAGARTDLVDNKRGRSALALACECGSEGAALMLVAASSGGAELSRADALSGRTPLDSALARGFGRAAEAIRARGGRTSDELKARR